MDVATITMPRELARAKLAEYRRALGRRASEEYAQAAALYEQAALGRPVLLLSQVFAECPRDAKGRPRVAIARADRVQVYYSRTWTWAASAVSERFSADFNSRPGPPLRGGVVEVPNPALRPEYVSGYSLVPMIPPDVARGRDLAKHFVLWEVDQWADQRLGNQPDRDPYLLVRIAPDAFAVVAEWDLTDVERAIMRGRVGG